jgi:hypothetical protein
VRAFKDRGLPGVVADHRLASRRIGQVTITLEQRFHSLQHTSLDTGRQDRAGPQSDRRRHRSVGSWEPAPKPQAFDALGQQHKSVGDVTPPAGGIVPRRTAMPLARGEKCQGACGVQLTHFGLELSKPAPDSRFHRRRRNSREPGSHVGEGRRRTQDKKERNDT